jgi:hypothetical protein
MRGRLSLLLAHHIIDARDRGLGLTLENHTAEMDKALQISGRFQRLDPADQGVYRHAFDGPWSILSFSSLQNEDEWLEAAARLGEDRHAFYIG